MIRRTLQRLKNAYMWRQVSSSVKHVSGPAHFELKSHEVAVFCLVKNADFFLADFIDHHVALGARNIVLIDNGSTDNTLEIAESYPNVTVIQSLLPVKSFECLLRQYAAKRFASNHWCLFVDSDEQFDYPFSDQLNLPQLAMYLTENRYTAVVTQMLDMFTESSDLSASSSLAAYNNYALEALEQIEYHSPDSPLKWFLQSNEVSNADIQFLYGGVRKLWFDLDCCLTKHSMVHFTGKVAPVVHPHCARNVRCADFSAMVRHYKFAGDFQSRIENQVKQKVWDHGEDETYLQQTVGPKKTALQRPINSHQFESARELLDQGFLIASNQFRKYVSELS